MIEIGDKVTIKGRSGIHTVNRIRYTNGDRVALYIMSDLVAGAGLENQFGDWQLEKIDD